jgi:PilZ domain
MCKQIHLRCNESARQIHMVFPPKCKYFSLETLWKKSRRPKNQQLTFWPHNCSRDSAVWEWRLFQESQRAIDIMRCKLPEQRREVRTHSQISGTVINQVNPQDTRTAVLRDLNTLGAFFYSKLSAEVGEALALQILMPQPGNAQLKIACEGTVVRVEPEQADVGTGFALQFSRYDMSWIH